MRCLRSVAAGLACALAVLVSSLSPARAQSLTWTGTVSNAWDIQTTTNWLNPSGVQDYYYDGRNVTFGDSAANTNIAITAGGVAPASVTFTNNTTPYTLSGGPINDMTGGTTAVTLNGSGSVTFSATNNYTGGTTINAGTLVSASQYCAWDRPDHLHPPRAECLGKAYRGSWKATAVVQRRPLGRLDRHSHQLDARPQPAQCLRVQRHRSLRPLVPAAARG